MSKFATPEINDADFDLTEPYAEACKKWPDPVYWPQPDGPLTIISGTIDLKRFSEIMEANETKKSTDS